MPHELKPYQTEAVGEIGNRFGGRSLLSFDMGLGKTVTALSYLSENPATLPAIVVCPAIVKHQWEREAADQFGWRPTVLHGERPPGDGLCRVTSRLTIINYDILQYWLDWLRGAGFRTIIVDECQYLANQTAIRTQAVRNLSRGVVHALALSGSPLLNRPSELYPTLHILRPDVFDSFWGFSEQFCGPRIKHGRWDHTGAKNLDKLHDLLLQTCMIRRLKSEVLTQLPAKIRTVVPLELSDVREYRRATTDFIGWVTGAYGRGRAIRAARSEQISRLSYLKQLAARLKLRAAVEWINNLLSGTDEKIVVFAYHTKMIEALKRRINARSVVIDGGTLHTHRHQNVHQFRNDPLTRVCLVQTLAGGVGLDGLQVAQTCVFTELTWRPGDCSQAESRLERIGQTGRVFAYYLVAAGTIEETLCGAIDRKQRILSTTLDGGPTDEDFNLMDLLTAKIQSEGESCPS